MTSQLTTDVTVEALAEAGRGEHRYERLTALDASFLHAETEDTPMHLGALSIFEGAPFFDETGAFRLDRVQRQVSSRLHLLPRFRKKLMQVPFGQGRPVWVDDPFFDIADHVKLMVLPEPGNRDELEALCEQLQMRLLDREHPLWELWFIGGLHDGRVAMVEKLHHTMVDGVSGVDVAGALLDLEPVPPEPPPADRDVPSRWVPAPTPTGAELLLGSLWERVTEPIDLARGVRAALQTPARVVRGAVEVVEAAASLVAWLAPTSSINSATVGHTRRLVHITVPLDQVKQTKRVFGTTVNDVVLAAVAGGLRGLFLERGESCTGRNLRVLVPVSVRSDEEHLSLGNQVSSVVASLPVSEPSALQRLMAVKESMVSLKEHHQAQGNVWLLGTADHVPPFLLSALARSIHHQPYVNIVVTNIPGPPFPLYFMGAKMVESTPIVPLAGNLTIGIAILSYNGALTIGIHADGAAVPDVGVLADGITASFAEMLAFSVMPDA